MIQSYSSLATLSAPFEASLEAVIVIDEYDRIVYANPAACRITGYRLDELLGSDAYAAMPPAAREQLREAIRKHEADQAPGTIMRGTSALVRPSGEEFEIEYTSALLMLNGRCLVAVMFHDTTEMKRMARKVEALSEIASHVAIADPLETTLRKLAESVVRATGTVACAVCLADEKGEFRVWGDYGLPNDPESEERWRECEKLGADLPNMDSVKERRPLVFEQARTKLLQDPRFEPIHPYLREAAWETVASVPMMYRNNAIGALQVFYPRGKNPGQMEITFLSAIAGQAAVAAENSRLFAQAKEKAILEERQRLARELHDSVSQALYGIALGARTARAMVDRDPAQIAEPLDYVLSLADAGLAEMRALIFELRPETLETEGLLPALTKQIDSVRARHGLEITTEWCDEPDFSFEIKETVYRIAQESLNNIVKHAKARRVDLRLSCGGLAIELEVKDDGVGFAPDADHPGHLGLRSMRERASQLGGTLIVESAPNLGTRVYASIPRSNGTAAPSVQA